MRYFIRTMQLRSMALNSQERKVDPKAYISAVKIHGEALYKASAKLRVDVPEGKAGLWAVQKFETVLDMTYLRFARENRPPGLGEMTRLIHKDRGTVMSDTCAEIEDLLRYIHNLRGNLLVTGLGLGMIIHMLTKVKEYKGQVDTITVIEKDKDVIKLVAPHYLKNKKVAIIQGDAFLWKPSKHAKFDSAWHDIWDTIDERAREEYGELRRRYRGVVAPGQQFCWGQHSR